MDVTINETREHKFSAGVDDFCAHAAPPFNFWIVTRKTPSSRGPRPLRSTRKDRCRRKPIQN